MLNKHRLLSALTKHIGRSNGVSSRCLVAEADGDLFAANDATMRQLRNLIVELRREGHHICGHPSTGYYIAETPQELDSTCKFLLDRAMTSLQQIAAMKRVSVPDLHGQLRLPT